MDFFFEDPCTDRYVWHMKKWCRTINYLIHLVSLLTNMIRMTDIIRMAKAAIAMTIVEAPCWKL